MVSGEKVTVLNRKLMTHQMVQTLLTGHGVFQIQTSVAYTIDIGNIKPSIEFKSDVIDIDFLLSQYSVLEIMLVQTCISTYMFSNFHY